MEMFLRQAALGELRTRYSLGRTQAGATCSGLSRIQLPAFLCGFRFAALRRLKAGATFQRGFASVHKQIN